MDDPSPVRLRISRRLALVAPLAAAPACAAEDARASAEAALRTFLHALENDAWLPWPSGSPS
jgi:hypothetical protein